MSDVANQPAPQRLTDEQITNAFNSLPDGAQGFLKKWGYLQFAREIERLTHLCHKPHKDSERWLSIGQAIERACSDQPTGTEIIIELERGAGTVTLIDQDGNEHDNFDHEDGFAGVVHAAINAAIASQGATDEKADCQG